MLALMMACDDHSSSENCGDFTALQKNETKNTKYRKNEGKVEKKDNVGEMKKKAPKPKR